LRASVGFSEGTASAAAITSVFVLMLENRSFDHLLGFSGITGTDAEMGGQTSVEGPGDGRTNSYNGTTYSEVQSRVTLPGTAA
jgi:phospholipase C